MLGLHMSFCHSWRGNAPDETGFGTDIRVVRGVLRQLNQANAHGLDARAYWDFTVHWTLEQFLPLHAPDIIEGIRERVETGLDEVVMGPYNNGVTSASTEKEFLKALQWTRRNPFGSGLEQVFGKVSPVYRPQEAFLTTGQLVLLKKAGVEAVILPYANTPFTAFSNFVPPLTAEERFHPVWIRTSEDGPRLPALLSLSIPDVISYKSLENLMHELRALQVNRNIRRDLVIHINFDADAETWLPIAKGIPNLGGISEYIEAVNKVAWARFTTPAECLKEYEPQKEVQVRQDLADGAFDGYASALDRPGRFLHHRVRGVLPKRG
jgi:hypothetical protein